MQLHYLLVVVVSDTSDVKVMSSAVAVIFAITCVVTIIYEPNPVFLTEPNQTHSEPNHGIFSKTEQRLKNLFRTSLVTSRPNKTLLASRQGDTIRICTRNSAITHTSYVITSVMAVDWPTLITTM